MVDTIRPRAALPGFGTKGFVTKNMKTVDRENPNRRVTVPRNRTWRGRSEQILLHQVGWKQEKFRAAGDVFSS